MITQSELKEALSYDKLTGQFIWKKLSPRAFSIRVGDTAGSQSVQGYWRIRINGKLYTAHRLAWLYCYGQFPDCEIDHINGDKSDNRLCNLRIATKKQNQENVTERIDNKSGCRGVFWNTGQQKWTAQVGHCGKRHHIGYFDVLDDAVKAVKEARNKLFTHHLTCYSA